MAKTYQVITTTRLANLFVKALVRAGIGAKGTYLLTVRGRKSGRSMGPVSGAALRSRPFLGPRCH
jgi:hypothetical protein